MFCTVVNILDKIAFFINDYLALGVDVDRVGFNTIWKTPRGNTLRNEVLVINDFDLYGLYDISCDMSKDGYLYHLRNLRNYLTHRYLIPHVEAIDFRIDADGADYHIGYQRLFEQTVQLMQLVRSAILYLAIFVDRQERIKHQNTQEFIAPMLVDFYDHYPHGPGTSPI